MQSLEFSKMVHKQPTKDKNLDKTTGLYKIAAKIIKKVKTGSSYKTQLYQAQYPNKLLLNAVVMNVFKWEKVIDLLVEKSNILEKENCMDPELIYVLITELMWSKFGLKGNAKNILAIKKYKTEFSQLMKEDEIVKLSVSKPTKVFKPRFFRVNTLVTSLEDILKKLAQHKFNKLKTPKTYAEFLELIKSDKFKGNTFVQDVHIKELLVFNSKVKFYNLEEYNNGSLIIQDKASCLAAFLLNPEPESTVLDMCAAPGMKTSYLAALMKNTGKLYAVDRCKNRYNIMQNMLEKYEVKNVETFNMDALTFPYYDDVKYILVDPSCSGSGIVDRVRNESVEPNDQLQIRLKKLANVHAQLLNHALKSYPKLERLVYSTCSANHEENEAVVDEALSVNGKFKLLDCTKMVKGWVNKGAPGYDCSDMCLNAVPSDDCTNGFFIAVFVRRDLEEKEETDEVTSKIMNEDFSEAIDEENSVVIHEEDSQISDSETKTNKCISQEKKKKKLKKSKTVVEIENTVENLKPTKKRKVIDEDENPEPVKKCKKIEKIENPVENLKSTKKRKVIDKVENSKPNKKCKKIEKIENPVENSELAEKSKIVKTVNSELVKKSKNVKRRERRLKLEQANGVTTKTKNKKNKREKI